MANILKPNKLNLLWASGGDILDPGDTKYQTGWGVEVPPRQWENYIQNKQDQAIAHINQHGIAVWDAETEYQADTSYTQGATNGTIYRAKVTHSGQNPELDTLNTYWDIAFAAAGDFYTKAEVDADFLAKDQNLGDLLSTSAARTNLNVYSKAETYTKTEVDGKTTIASATQARELTSNAVLLTPQRLKDAVNATSSLPIFAPRAWGFFNGLNGTIRASGNIGSIARTAPGVYTVTFTTPMSSINYAVVGSANQLATGVGGEADTFTAFNRTTSGFTITTFTGNSVVGDCTEISFLVMGD